ncbi:Cysteine desulfurase [Rubripirellula amarantea]|uniref:cysteine desulfurase n=1 Tax=Rubripirellula amarantea TaxID=2527999 RepID=A0A5C5WK09_9BACT|nr:cysteine desulfurase family protein [Rubripirellula amarantea]TWT50980.1 Cysteine desulfurase [Rubripirellula amarantea]
MKPEIYLDNNATTHPSDEVREALSTAINQDFGNASSEHRSGEKTRRAIMQARDSVALLLGAKSESIVFGSGVTELNYWVLTNALRGHQSPHLVTSQVEHSCVIETANILEAEGIRVTRMPVGRDGRLDIDSLTAAVADGGTFVSVQWANNETGVIQPIREIAAICRRFKVPFHCDAAQATGRLRVNFSGTGIDYLTASAHKMHGPTGIGALCVKEPRTLQPLFRGGNQETGLRPGTENTLGIIGFGRAASEREGSFDAAVEVITKLRDQFESLVLSAIPQIEINGSTEDRLCNSTNMMFPGLDGAAIVALLDREGIRCSQSSACTSNRPEPSYVLRAMGLSEDEAFASVRFSFSNQNTMVEVETAAAKLVSIVARLSGFQSPPSQSDYLQGAAKHEV